MSLNLSINKARLTVFGYGWDDAVVDSGDANTDEGSALEEYVENTDYEFPDDFDWDAVAEDMGVELDDDGNITDTDTLDDNLYDLANDADAIIDYMTEKNESIIPPARIVILNPPDVTEYTEGDTIDYSGIIVAAFTSLTTMTPFINSALEGEVNNLIPFDQLTFPVTTAEKDGDKMSSDLDLGNVTQPVTIGGSVIVTNDTYQYIVTGNIVAGFYNTSPTEGAVVWVQVIVASESPGSYTKQEWRNGALYSETTVDYSSNYTYDEKTVYYACFTLAFYFQGGGPASGAVNGIDGTHFPSNPNGTAWTMVYGESSGAIVSIPVQWQTEYQTDPFEDTFDITFTEA